MSFSPEMRVFIIVNYLETKSYEMTRKMFRERFGEQYAVYNSTIKRVMDRFRNEHRLETAPRSGRPVTVRTPQHTNEIQQEIATTPRLSVRKLAARVHSSRTSVHRTLRALHLHPYRISSRQELKPPDYGKRLRFCQWFQRFTHSGMGALDRTFFTDEAWVHLDGYVNAQNFRIWSSENPHAFVERGLHPQKVGVWCAVSRRRVVGPFFFYDTITAARYQVIVRDFIASLEIDERDSWFQQDGAPGHSAGSTTDLLREFFGERLIAKGLWPPRSCDMTPPDYFLWGMVKDYVFSRHPTTLADLERLITEAIATIDRRMLKRVFLSMKRRVEACIANAGGHVEHFL